MTILVRDSFVIYKNLNIYCLKVVLRKSRATIISEMFTKKLLIAATAAVAVTNGIPIKGGCLVKSDLFGNTASSTGTAFD